MRQCCKNMNHAKNRSRPKFQPFGAVHSLRPADEKTAQANANCAAAESGRRGKDGKLNEYRLFRMFARFDARIYFVPAEDVLQTIRTEIVCETGHVGEVEYDTSLVRAVMKAIHRTLYDYGYSRNPRNSKPLRRGGKEFRFPVDESGVELPITDPSCICGYGSVMPELCECGMSEPGIRMTKYIESLYRTHSAKEVCEILGIKFTGKIQKAFHRAFPKNCQPGTIRGGNNKKGKAVSQPEPCRCENCGQIQSAVMKVRNKNGIYPRYHKSLFCPQCKQQTTHWRVEPQKVGVQDEP